VVRLRQPDPGGYAERQGVPGDAAVVLPQHHLPGLTGSPAFPLGAALDFAELEENPYPVLARLREDEPVTWCESFGGWLVSDRAFAEEVLRDDDRFTVESPASLIQRVLGEHMLTRDGDEHRRQRAPFDPPLRLRPVRERYAEPIAEIANELVDSFAAEGAADLRPAYARILPVCVMAAVLGLTADDAAAVTAWYDDFARALANYDDDPTVEKRARSASTALRRRLLADLASPPPDSLIAHAAGKGLDDEELARNLGILLFGGIETMESSILNTLWELFVHPDQLDAVRAEPELAANAVEEALRFEAPVQILDRWAIRDTELGGVEIGRGDWVSVLVGAVNRDPRTFPDPDRFDIRRPNADRHISFAYGPHLCIGFNLARLETRIAVEVVLERLPGLRLDPEASEPPRGSAFRKPPRLGVLWDV
jgi:cytochrome P450